MEVFHAMIETILSLIKEYWNGGLVLLPFLTAYSGYAVTGRAMQIGEATANAFGFAILTCIAICSAYALQVFTGSSIVDPIYIMDYVVSCTFILQWYQVFIGPISLPILFFGVGYVASMIILPGIFHGGRVIYVATIFWLATSASLALCWKLTKAGTMAIRQNQALGNYISAIVILLLCFAGFKFLDGNFKIAVWFLFLLVAYPVVLAFVISLSTGTAKFTDKSLVDLYRDGLKQVPIIGKLLFPGGKQPPNE